MFGIKKIFYKGGIVDSRDEKIEYLMRRVEMLERDIEKLRCCHGDIKFHVNDNIFGIWYVKSCNICDETLEVYGNKEDWLKAKADYYEQKSQEIKEELNE